MNEIVLSGFGGKKDEVRRYARINYQTFTNKVVLKQQSNENAVMSQFSPLMFTVQIHPDGIVKLTKDGDILPFLEFREPNFSFDYLAYVNYGASVIHYFDCPLVKDRRGLNGIVFF